MALKMWVVEFSGYWPVGAVAIVEAESAADAAGQVYAALPTGLKDGNEPDQLEPREYTGGVDILLDGNY